MKYLYLFLSSVGFAEAYITYSHAWYFFVPAGALMGISFYILGLIRGDIDYKKKMAERAKWARK